MSKKHRNKVQAEVITEQDLGTLEQAAAFEAPVVEEAQAEGSAPAIEAAAVTTEAAVPAVPKPPMVLGKYAPAVDKNGDVTPSTFKYRDTPLFANVKPQERAAKEGAITRPSVRLIIWDMVRANPGITGSELVELMREYDWSAHPSFYVKGEKVARPWCTDYITAQLRKKRNHLTTVAPVEPMSEADQDE